MSSANLWLSIGAVVIVALFLVNSIVYRIRFGTLLRREKAEAIFGATDLSAWEIAVFMLPALALFAAFAALKVAPASDFAVWLESPLSWFVYAVWIWFVLVLLLVVPKAFKILRNSRNESTGRADA